jgi:IclR family acetate operon transcriptional repressor
MQALDRLVAILEDVARRPAPAGAAEVAESMGLPLSTVARLMRQLADEQLLERSERDGRYALGPRLFALARAATSRLHIVERARPVLEQLRDTTGETTSLHVLSGVQRVCLLEVQSQHALRRVVPAGMTSPLAGTATGEVLLAGAAETDRRAAIDAAGLPAAERLALAGRLDAIRANGYALVDDWVEGLTGLSAPIAAAERTVAAISISGPNTRFSRERALGHVDAVLAAAARLSMHAGDRTTPYQEAS